MFLVFTFANMKSCGFQLQLFNENIWLLITIILRVFIWINLLASTVRKKQINSGFIFGLFSLKRKVFTALASLRHIKVQTLLHHEFIPENVLKYRKTNKVSSGELFIKAPWMQLNVTTMELFLLWWKCRRAACGKVEVVNSKPNKSNLSRRLVQHKI